MTIYVDDAVWPYRGTLYCHMMSDEDLEELHEFADRLGLKRSWFQNKKLGPHYDLSFNMRLKAIRMGAVSVSGTDLVKICVLAKRKGEV